MEKRVEEVKKLVPTKSTTDIGDVVLILAAELEVPIYARVTNIERDTSRKDEWWHVHLAILAIPIQVMAWTLRTEQMTGKEIFTMGGEPRFMQAVQFEIEQPKEPAVKRTRNKVTPLKRVK